MSNDPNNHGYPQQNPRSAEIRNTDIQADVRADIGATDIGARFKTDICGCTDILNFTDIQADIRTDSSTRAILTWCNI